MENVIFSLQLVVVIFVIPFPVVEEFMASS